MRSDLSHLRTLLAWVRTSVSLIGFGFTIYHFYSEFLGDLRRPAPPRGGAQPGVGDGRRGNGRHSTMEGSRLLLQDCRVRHSPLRWPRQPVMTHRRDRANVFIDAAPMTH